MKKEYKWTIGIIAVLAIIIFVPPPVIGFSDSAPKSLYYKWMHRNEKPKTTGKVADPSTNPLVQ